MTTATGSAPRCKPLCCKIDHDADVLLRTMVPTGRGIGLLLSELIRKEARERALRPQWVQARREERQARQDDEG